MSEIIAPEKTVMPTQRKYLFRVVVLFVRIGVIKLNDCIIEVEEAQYHPHESSGYQ